MSRAGWAPSASMQSLSKNVPQPTVLRPLWGATEGLAAVPWAVETAENENTLRPDPSALPLGFPN